MLTSFSSFGTQLRHPPQLECTASLVSSMFLFITAPSLFVWLHSPKPQLFLLTGSLSGFVRQECQSVRAGPRSLIPLSPGAWPCPRGRVGAHCERWLNVEGPLRCISGQLCLLFPDFLDILQSVYYTFFFQLILFPKFLDPVDQSF